MALNKVAETRVHAMEPVWEMIRSDATELVGREPLMASSIHAAILRHDRLEAALAFRLADRLANSTMPQLALHEILITAYESDASLAEIARADIVAVFERDPACYSYLHPLLFFKGFQAIQAHRIGHWLWGQGRPELAYYLQSQVSTAFSVDIHPAAQLGRGIFMDHAHGVVIGETAVVGDDVSILHAVTLGGTGKAESDRHPKIGRGVLIGAGAKILGNITVGECSRIAAGSVVLQDIPRCKTVAGVPARIVGDAGCDRPSDSMDHLVE